MSAELFPITYWYGVPPSEATFERYQEVAEAGFNIAQAGGTREQIHQVLGWCAGIGIKACVMDSRMPRAGQLSGEEWKKQIAAIVKDFHNHPALWGYFITDEPSADLFADLGKICAEFKRLDPDHPAYINLFPNYADTDQLGTETYDEHLARYISETAPPLVSYDHYCLMDDDTRQKGYYANLTDVRRHSLEAGLDFWQIILSSALHNLRDPNEADMRWQVWTSLAYGAKGISYFTYWSVPADNFRAALIDHFGERTHQYTQVQLINRELQNVTPTLLTMNSLGVVCGPGVDGAHTDPYTPQFISELPEDPLVVGEFEIPDHKGALVVVNDDLKRSKHTMLKVADGIETVRIFNRYSGQPGQNVAIEDGRKIWFYLAPGDGVLLLLD